MTQSKNTKNLIQALQAHYHNLVNLIAVLRLKAYRPEAKSSSSKKLAKQLRNYINHFPTTGPDSSGVNTHDDKQTKVADMTTSRLDKEKNFPAHEPDHHPLFSDKHQVNSVGEKLMKSTWEHLHASIRYARAGNTETAKLHANIMDSALKEAAHFLDDEAYQDFVLNLGKEMSKLVWEDKPDAIKQPSSHEIH